MESSFSKFSVFTLNIWGLPFVFSKNKSQRIDAITSALEKLDFDVVCFQEVWTRKDFQTLKRRLSHIFPFYHYYHSGVNGSGLCTFSKWPIVDTFFCRFSINGYFHMIHHGDWLGGKGIALAQLNINGFVINVYNTHLHAQYNENFDQYFYHRLIQALEVGAFIKLTSNSANGVILAGDLNSEPDDLCLKVIRNTAGLCDSYDFRETSRELGTNDCHNNSFSTERALGDPNYIGKRIDYILFRHNQGLKLKVKSYTHPLEDRVPGTNFSYSDHEAIGCTFDLIPGTFEIACNIVNTSPQKQILDESIEVCNAALIRLKKNQIFYFALAIIALISLTSVVPFFHSIHSYFPRISMLIVSLLFFFSLTMATIWNQLEVKSVRNAKKKFKLKSKYLEYEKLD